ncbi:MAG: acetyltransferase [Phycisphaeraceae bacterium]|nr:MAG: acetyltransferase [Phycisphaeraceae bacterium]
MDGNPPEFEPRPITTRDGRALTLRAAAPSDAPALRLLYIELSETSEFGVIERDEVMPDEPLRESVEEGSAKGWLWIVVEGAPGSIVGDCIVRPEKYRRLAHNATIGLGLADGWRGVGLGRAVMDASIDWSRAHPALRRLELQVFASNAPAIGLYESLGFEREGRHPDRVVMPGGRAIGEIRMALDVAP